jgi:hypothetical protein
LESFLPLIKLILPEFIIENHLLSQVEKSEESYHVYLEEKNYPEDDPKKSDLLSKGYFPTSIGSDRLKRKRCFQQDSVANKKRYTTNLQCTF